MSGLSVITFPSVDGTAADEVEMTLAWIADATSAGVQSSVDSAIGDLLNDVIGGICSLSALLSPRLDHTISAVVHRLYNLAGHEDGSPHGSPVNTFFHNLDAPYNAEALPDQSAAVVKWRASYSGTTGEQGAYFTEPVPHRAQVFGAPATVTGPVAGHPKVARIHPRARLRGRVYVGPLNTFAVGTDAITKGAQVSASAGDVLTGAFQRLWDDLSSGGVQLAVWSRRDVALKPVIRATIQNDREPHVIRRRTHRF